MDYKKLIETISKFIPHPQALEMNKWIDELRKENQDLRDEIQRLKGEIENLKAPSSAKPPQAATCPNCSTIGRPFYMSPVPKDFVELENATHECSRCKYKTRDARSLVDGH
jgi:FtsZ-binding cell division protein ZapB